MLLLLRHDERLRRHLRGGLQRERNLRLLRLRNPSGILHRQPGTIDDADLLQFGRRVTDRGRVRAVDLEGEAGVSGTGGEVHLLRHARGVVREPLGHGIRDRTALLDLVPLGLRTSDLLRLLRSPDRQRTGSEAHGERGLVAGAERLGSAGAEEGAEDASAGFVSRSGENAGGLEEGQGQDEHQGRFLHVSKKMVDERNPQSQECEGGCRSLLNKLLHPPSLSTVQLSEFCLKTDATAF